MEIILILLPILCSIAITLYKRSKSLRFRVVEDVICQNVASKYSAQVRLNGVWFYLNPNAGFLSEPSDSCHISPIIGKWYLDEHDVLVLIEQFKSAGNFTIPSNRKLNSNEKQIIVE